MIGEVVLWYASWFLLLGLLEWVALAVWDSLKRRWRERQLAQCGRLLPAEQYLAHRRAGRGTTLESWDGGIWWTADDVLRLSPVAVAPEDCFSDDETTAAKWEAFCHWCWPKYIAADEGTAYGVPLRVRRRAGCGFGPLLPRSLFIHEQAERPEQSNSAGCLIGVLLAPMLVVWALGVVLTGRFVSLWSRIDAFAMRRRLPPQRRMTAVPADEGTVIREIRGAYAPSRFWWSPDDLADLSPFPANTSDRATPCDAEFTVFYRWCAERYTSPLTGSGCWVGGAPPAARTVTIWSGGRH